jgi:selenocysteine-specific elongation factor
LDVIIGTAGHIDHGKTTLVQALTGVDADRLPEEKRRGITIDIGFAELKLGDHRFGFVDVPGHERFVKNMLAGAHGIDLVALVIAADEGVMPQTREHFDICRLLDVRAGLIVLTKTDTVEPDLLELVQEEARELVAGSFLATAPMIAVSARTGAGLDQLKAALTTCADELPPRTNSTVARLPIDRAFTMRGFGPVVTGTLIGGELAEGSELDLLPAGDRVRVRGLQVHGEKVHAAVAGQRTAVNLSGVETAAIERGLVLAEAGRLRPTQMIDAQVSVLPHAPKALRTRARVRVHLGAAEVLARLQVLEETTAIAPGASGLVQLRTETPVVPIPGDRFIIRSYSPSHTIAGGLVLDGLPVKHRGRDRGAARESLGRLLSGDEVSEIVEFVRLAGDAGLSRADLAARTGWNDRTKDEVCSKALRNGAVTDAAGVLVDTVVLAGLADRALAMVREHHRREPLSRGLSRETLRDKLFARTPTEVFQATLGRAIADGSLVLKNQLVRAAEHSVTISPADLALKDELTAVYRTAGLEPPDFAEAWKRLTGPVKRDHARKLLQLLLDAGELKQITGEVFCDNSALEDLTRQLDEYARQHEPDRMIDVAGFKELTGVSRKYAIPLLEYLDRSQVTRRAGDKRLILKREN